MRNRDFSGQTVDGYLIASLLGIGSAGSVYQATDISLPNSPQFAIKCVRERNVGPRWRQQLAEIENHRAVALCPNVMTLRDAFRQDGYLFLVLPLCATDMFRAIWFERVYFGNDVLIKGAFVDLLDGVFACHKQCIFHCDLKPENIMCDAGGRRIAIGDFGLSTSRRFCRGGGCGTATYMSPECWDECGIYDAAQVDVWSLGVILFNMVTSRYPWDEARPKDEAFAAFLNTGDAHLRPFGLAAPLRALLCRIWHLSPERRLTIPAIKQAIVDMVTFYDPHPPCDVSVLPAEHVLTGDSQKTFVTSLEDKKHEDIVRPEMDVLEEIPLSSPA